MVSKPADIKLTKRTIDSLQSTGVRRDVWDSELPGFGLRLEASGTRTFIVRYRAGGGGRKAKRRFMTVGRFGVLTPEQARQKARQILASVAIGDDPAGARAAKRKEMTVAELLKLYEAEGCFIQRGKRRGQPMKSVTKQFTLARLTHHALPLLGTKKVTEVRPADIERFARDVAAGKTAKDEKVGPRRRIIVRGGTGAARKVVRDLSAVFSFAHRHEIMSENPCDAAAVNKTDNRNTGYLTLEQVRRLGAALDEFGAHEANPKALNITRLWALTGCRRNEIAALKWSEVDFERSCLVLDDSKTGVSIRPLGAPALALLRVIPRVEESEYVFPAERGVGFYQGTKRVWPVVVKRAGLQGATPHTLRHTLGSTSVSAGETLAMTGAILGHANMRSTQIYAHLQADPAARATERVVRSLAAALERRPTAKVTPIRRTRS
jgi:integrase